jgi:hypothetical protein
MELGGLLGKVPQKLKKKVVIKTWFISDYKEEAGFTNVDP